MRGTENPQMSASSTPTVSPRAASAAARLTVTDDLPTPPLPDAMRMTLAASGTDVSSGRWATFHRALAMAVERCSGGHLGPAQPHVGHAGQRPDPGHDVVLELRPAAGSPAVVSATVTSTDPSADDLGAPRHAQVDDVAAELGIDDAAEHRQHVVRGGEGGGHAGDSTGRHR